MKRQNAYISSLLKLMAEKVRRLSSIIKSITGIKTQSEHARTQNKNQCVW